MLNVQRLTFQMVYDELLQLDPATPVKKAKELIWAMNTVLGTKKVAPNPEKLLKRQILPVRFPNGDVRLVSIETDFAVVDRRPLELLFQDKLNLLDFSRDEIRRLRRFLFWAKLKDRFLSSIATETSFVDDTSTYPLSDSSREIRKKAHALTR